MRWGLEIRRRKNLKSCPSIAYVARARPVLGTRMVSSTCIYTIKAALYLCSVWEHFRTPYCDSTPAVPPSSRGLTDAVIPMPRDTNFNSLACFKRSTDWTDLNEFPKCHYTHRQQSRGVGFSPVFVCLSLCLFIRTISQKPLHFGSTNLT